MTELYDALEKCLEAMEHGASIETALRRYPGLAAELRPLLAASLMARSSSRIHVPLDVRRRGRSRLQQQVAQREAARGASRRRMIPAFPRIALTAILAAALVLTSTGLVSASSASLPGEQLYPVKRTWESFRLLFAFSPQQHDIMESEYEQERLNEISELLGQGKAAPISFSGILAQQADGRWVVSGIPVSVTAATLPTTQVVNGVPINVTGITRSDGVVEAQQIQVLQPGASLPPLEPSESNQESHGQGEEGEGAPTLVASPTPSASKSGTSGSETEHVSYQYSGVIQSMQGNVWTINGQVVHVDAAQISGQATVGSIVRFSGYYNSDGTFVVTVVEPQSGGSGNKHSPSGGGEGGDSGQGGDSGEGSGSGGEGP